MKNNCIFVVHYTKISVKKLKKMKKRTLKIALVLLVLLTTEYMFSQTPPPNRAPGPPGLPIDGGLFTLISLAFGYGVSKLRNKK